MEPEVPEGLLLPIERKNVENMAEQVGGHPRRLQEFVSESPWDDAGCIEEVQRMIGEKLGTREGVLVLDDTGFPKKGKCYVLSGTARFTVGDRVYDAPAGTLRRIDEEHWAT